MTSTRRKANAAVLIVTPMFDGTAGTPVTLSGQDRGLSIFGSQDLLSIRRKPSAGPYETFQLTGYRTGQASIQCDDNAVTHALFLGKTGRRFKIVYREQGTKSGNPEESFEAVADIGMNIEQGGARTFSVTFNADGGITSTTQT